ncbi:hypothetical protein BKA56DRAFT_673473 [Ilyonectria sp. MPI-CAGE-AT-0026]|nr:hypothetical protein BKA56DRAFT_673473 [Ilyonectria sp. MPI-CAGE-AT-0026]
MQFNIFSFLFVILAASQVQAALSVQSVSASVGKVFGLVEDATQIAHSIEGNFYRGAVPRLVVNTRNIIGLLTGEVQNALGGLDSIGGDSDQGEICSSFDSFTKVQRKFLNTITSKGDILTGGPAAAVMDNILHALKRGVDGVSAGMIAGLPSCVTAKDNMRTLDEALDEALESMS